MKLGSLFDGIGGFPLAASRNGITAVWASEIEKGPIEITKKHFPNMLHLGDITKINGAEIEPVDIISFGSPCQDLSVAGKREGLEGARSGLFIRAINIIRQMQHATNGKYPRYAIWENVPGAFSSNKGLDFKTVLEKITASPIPMPSNEKWAASGMVEWGNSQLAWRVLDAQYWGVPQRRKRIYLVADFRGKSAGKILFECDSLPMDIKEGGSKGQEITGDTTNGIRETDREFREKVIIEKQSVFCVDTYNQSISEKATTIRAGGSIDNTPFLWATFMSVAVPPLCAGQGGGVQMPTILLPKENNDTSAINKKSTYQKVIGCMCSSIAKGISHQMAFSDQLVANEDLVRRLTPTECERLQGYPDGWTIGHADTVRYKALGNSVAVPCVEFIMEQIVKVSNKG